LKLQEKTAYCFCFGDARYQLPLESVEDFFSKGQGYEYTVVCFGTPHPLRRLISIFALCKTMGQEKSKRD